LLHLLLEKDLPDLGGGVEMRDPMVGIFERRSGEIDLLRLR
jgi:hypothetical protein